MSTFINKLLGLVDNPEISIEEDKQQTVNLILYITNILGVLSLGSAILEYYVFGITGSGLLYIAFFSPFIFALLFRKRLSVKAISILFISSGYLVAVYIMSLEGFFGATLIVFLTIVVFATFLLGLKEGFITLAICLLTIVVFAFIFTNEILQVHPSIVSSYKNWTSWLAVFLTFLFLGTILSLSIYRIHKKLNKSLDYSDKKTRELRSSNDELTQIKKNLEGLVKKRTIEIESKNKELITSNEELQSLNDELERFNSLFVGREFRIKELRDKVKALEKEING